MSTLLRDFTGSRKKKLTRKERLKKIESYVRHQYGDEAWEYINKKEGKPL